MSWQEVVVWALLTSWLWAPLAIAGVLSLAVGLLVICEVVEQRMR